MSLLLLPVFLLSLLSLHAPPPATATATAIAAATGVHGYGGDKQVLTLNKFKQATQLQTNTPNCFPQRSKKSATILELYHRDYCSRPRSDWNQRFLEHLLSDQIRVRSLQSRIKIAFSKGSDQELSQAQIPITSGAKLQTLNYITTIRLGGRNVTLIVDTGSDITWVQCQPCGSCYNQQEPLFNPSESPSYKPIFCKSTTCQNLEYATGKSGICGFNSTNCNYYVSYGDGSYTQGDLASDDLVIGTVPIKGFVFGCGRVNSGLFGGASGLMGLGRSLLSLVSQTTDVFGGIFSYCLPSATDSGSGSLILGNGTSDYKNFSPISYTNMLSNPMMPTFYFLNLTGISIGGVSLQDPSFGKKELLIDSGTVITRLPPSIYDVFKSEFLNQFSGFPKAPAFSILDTCFNLSGYKEVEIPTIKMHFTNDVKFTIDVSGILYFAKSDASQVCLALAGLSDEEEIGIIGNYQQKNTRVVYNTKELTLGFAKETCSSD
ncbi:aspartyl protease family protein At5g10770 [Cynara cardunculus var. scolymus]|uniref:Aspartic peptidase n=1 Tax=Cynara cardunculus var. scolymus TaxID=59895 RepID=A0A103XY87_CYNCS|nr:aspartyl protease family protein At5g10770 [Cynara cardunculus var. scolymus]KVH99044.1 Aspartic peptidase [Cynara cardunculus var. scolymus]